MNHNNNDEAKVINITRDVEPVKKDPEFPYTERWPSYGPTVRWTAKVDLYYLNGTTNSITMIMPVMKGGTEEVHKYFKSFACELATLFLPIEFYQISLGSIDKDGNEYYYINYEKEEVPTGKVWVNNWPLGMWMEPQKIIEGRRQINSLNNSTRGPYPFPYNEPHEIIEPTIY